MNRKAIAIDFDGCLCENAWPKIGDPHWAVIEAAKRELAAGTGLILWTCREGDLLQQAIDAVASWGLVFDAVNDNLPDWIAAWGNSPRKVGATEYWDDRAVRMPLIPGDAVWVVERDEDGNACDLSGYMFLAYSGNYVIVSAYINDLQDADETLEHHAQETAANYDTDLAVFPLTDCYTQKVDAENALAQEG